MNCLHTLTFSLVPAFLLTLGGRATAQQVQLPAYKPAPLEPGVIRSMGDDAMRVTMTAWEQAFSKYHPEITFENKLLGTATSMAGIITGSSDLSLMGRPATVNEIIGFEWVFRMKPVGVQVMNGSLQAEGHSPALAVFVSQRNPIQQISMAQLAEMLGCPATPDPSRTRSVAGAQAGWKTKPIHAYLYDDQTGTGAFLQRAIQGEKDCWNWDVVREFKDLSTRGTSNPAAKQIIEALQKDPNGLAISTLNYAGPSVRAVPIAGSGKPIALTKESITAGTYPLARPVYIYINRRKDKPTDPKVDEFLRFILSREGQDIVETSDDFLPLNAKAAIAEREKLK